MSLPHTTEDVPPSLPNLPINNGPRHNKESFLKPAEIDIIIGLRAELIGSTSDRERLLIIKKMVHMLREYWRSIDRQWASADEKAEVSLKAAKWITNNWRCKRPKRIPLYLNIQEHIWQTRQNDVWKVIASKLNVDKADSTTPGWLQVRQSAIAEVRQSIPKETLKQEAARIMGHGYQREKQAWLAEKLLFERVKTAHQHLLLEMGAVSIQFTVHRNSTDQFARHVKAMWALKDASAEAIEFPEPGTHESVNDMGLKVKVGVPTTFTLDKQGYPIIPETFDSKRARKVDMDRLFQFFTSEHYKLASGGRLRRVPWSEISPNMADFVDPQYLPDRLPDLVLTSYQNCGAQHMGPFLDHVLQRQLQHGPSNSFRFSHYVVTSGTGLARTTQRYPATYPDGGPAPQLAPPAKPKRIRNRGMERGKQKQQKRDKQAVLTTLQMEEGDGHRQPKSKEWISDSGSEDDTLDPPVSNTHHLGGGGDLPLPTPEATPAPDLAVQARMGSSSRGRSARHPAHPTTRQLRSATALSIRKTRSKTIKQKTK
ncbi:hypothetical protein CVT24_008131 [Panaeolus cyanescens]|uniref:Uncharacterized protein n=1 Tax=Panaeolus cyanescens TaxID=181874 RepID=A0A409WCW8_9AGAR|nr:hypothetical protein CVT24_008131 [Panaeolus cyanescens]